MGSGDAAKTGAAILLAALLAALLTAVPAGGAAGAEGGPATAAAGSFREQLGEGRNLLPVEKGEAAERRAGVMEARRFPRNPSGFSAASVQSGARGVTVSIPFDTVNGWITHAGGAARTELWRGPDLVCSVNSASQDDGWFYADLSQAGGDVLNGDRVRVIDLADMATADIDVNLTGVVLPNQNKIIGTTAAGNTVDVYINTPSFYYCDIPPGAGHVRAALTGTDYSAVFNDFPLRVGDAAYIFSTYPSGHRVSETAREPSGYSLVVYPQLDEVSGYAEPACDITVNAGSASRSVCSGKDGFFVAWFTDHDILPGENVSSTISGVPKSVTVADVTARADPGTNKVEGTAPANQFVRLTLNPNTDPIVMEGATDPSGGFSFDLEGRYTLQGNEVFNITWYDAEWDCVIYNFNTYSWYLPEGYTGPGFDEWVLVMNPSGTAAQVRVIFQTTDGPVNGPLFTASANSRSTVHVNEYVPGTMVSTLVTSTDGGQIIAERAMYMFRTIDGKWGSHDSVGILTPSSIWYLPEGYTGPGFDEWVLVQNPNARQVTVEVRFLTPSGLGKQFDITVPAQSRYTIHVNDHLQNTDVATRLESKTLEGGKPLPVYAERAMYMINTPDGKVGAHDSIGLSAVRNAWYMPEGTTRPGFDMWVLVMNPGGEAVRCKASFLTPTGVGAEKEFEVGAQSRYTIHVNDLLPNEDISTVVECVQGAGVLAERAMYMRTADGKLGAHDSIGASEPSTVWVLPEGTTRPGFDQWVLVQNPNDSSVAVRVTLLGPDGVAGTKRIEMGPRSRQSVHVNDMVSNLDVSTKVESEGINPGGILAERAMYMWTVDNKQGAHCSIGLPWADIF
jgi:hypothetical protein